MKILLCILMVFCLLGCEGPVEEEAVWVVPPPEESEPEVKPEPKPVVRRETTLISFPKRDKSEPKVLTRLEELEEISSIFTISKIRGNWYCKFYVEKEGYAHRSFSVNAKSFEEVVKRALDKAKNL